jgi:ATP-binding cassette subfamily B multidrug efflux pump
MNRLSLTLPALIVQQFKQYHWYYSGAVLCLFGTHYIQSHLPFYAKELADLVGNPDIEIGMTKFLFLAMGILFFRTSSRLLFFYPARVLQRDLRVECLEKIEETVPVRYEKFPPGQLFQIVFNDLEQLRALIGFALLQIGNVIVALIVLVPQLVSFNAKLSLALIPMGLTFFLFSLIVSRSRHLYREGQDTQGDIFEFLLESYNGKKTIKNYHAESSFLKIFDLLSLKELNLFFKAAINISFSVPLIPLGVGISLLLGSHIVFTEQLGASSLILFSGFIFLFLEPLMFVSWIGIIFARSIASWRRLKELGDLLDNETVWERNLITFNDKQKLTDAFVHFWNEKTKIDIVPNKWNVMIGKTGCGKSEVMKQLAQVYRLHKKNISYVAQTPYLYNDTIENNIFLGKEITKDSREAALKLLKLFLLDHLAANDSSLLSLEVGEHGKRLSGGQAKRLCLVRSLLADSEIILWDDPFSSVDVILEKEIISQLKKFFDFDHKTLIMTTHRLTSAKICDYLIFIEKNQGVIECGETDLLLTQESSKSYEYFERQLV